MIGIDNTGDIAVPQNVLVFTFLEVSVPRCVDEQHIPVGTVLPEYQDTSRNTGAVKQVGREANDCIQQIHFHQLTANFSLAGPAEQNTMGQHHCHAAVLRLQAGKHVQHKGVIAFRSGRHTPIKTMEGIQFSGHFFLALAVCFSFREESTVPLVQTERRICHHHLEAHQIIILNILRIGEGIALPNSGVIHTVQEHIHSAESPGLSVELLAIDSHLATGYFFIGFQQQTAAAAGRVVDPVVLLGLHQRGHQLRDLAWCEELASLLSGIRGEHGNHVLIGISDDIGRTQLTGTQIQTVEILQQVAQGNVLLFGLTKVYLRVEVDGPEYIAQLSTVVFLDMVQCHIDFLANFSIVPVGIEILEGGLLVHCKAFPAHGPFHPAHIPVILFDIVYDDFRDVFILWANNTGDVGYQNGQANFVEMRYSDDGITWGEPVRVNGFLGLDENGQQLAPWHQDVQYVPDLKEFVCISQCFAGRNPDGSVLHLTTSKDGVNWEQVGTKPLLSPGPDGSWDDFQIYRSSFYYEPGSSAGDGTMRVWYSALQKNTNNKMVADSSGNLTIQAKSEDDRIWRIGYAENSFVEMMRVLLDDPGYTTPALVSGNSLMLSAETTSLPTGDVMKLETSFAPVDTSDQVVKYTSSDPDVATVDEFGTITGVSVGSARIMAETREGLSDDLEIAVVENPYTLIPQSNMTATATSVYGGTTEGPASNVLDGNVRTIWHTNYAPKDELPQSITVSFDQPYTVGRFVYTPRQNGTNGIISEYELYAIHQDGSKDLVASGSDWALDAKDKTVSFAPVEAVGLELKAIAGAGGFGTAAELNVYAYGPIEPAPVYVPVDDRDASLVFTGAWNSDSNGSFYEGTARYTNEIGASVEFTFVGTAIRWYGQNDVNFGAAEVYVDGVLAGEVNVYGPAAAQQLLFEADGLAYGKHTIRIVCVSPVVDFDYFSYVGE